MTRKETVTIFNTLVITKLPGHILLLWGACFYKVVGKVVCPIT